MRHRYRLLAALVLLFPVALVMFWLAASRPWKPAATRSVDPQPKPLRPTGTSSTLGSRPDAPIAPTNASGSEQPSAATGAVQPQTRRRTLASEASAGPEVAPGLTPGVVLENMRGAFRQYSSRFGGNPVGTNREITSSLNGGNPSQVVFLDPEDGLRINEQGELIDNWGTPFFFHQLSAAEMEIHSAGPDRRMWTADDLVMK